MFSLIFPNLGAEFWRQHAEAVAMATFLGLHTPQLSNPLPEESASVQAKRKVFCGIFSADMLLSTLTGRPPLLSSRLCSIPLPLDIDDTVLLNAKIKGYRLDKDGWNIDGVIHDATFQRAAYIIARIRSEILELVLQAPNSTINHNFEYVYYPTETTIPINERLY
jgi:hypothetical protein